MGLADRSIVLVSSTYFDEPFVQSVYLLYRRRVGKRQNVGAESDHIAMLSMKLDMACLGPSPINIKESPPVRQRGQQRPWISVETMVEVVADKESDNTDEERCGPMVSHKQCK